MDTTRVAQRRDESIRRRFARYGVVGGVLIGFLLGVLYSGPYIRDWSLGSTVLVTLGFAAGGLFLGYLAEVISKATMAEGATGSFGGEGRGHFSTDGSADDHHDRNDAGGGGGDGGGGSGGGA